MGKKKILIFSGAGISKESGITTFRDGKDSLWNKYNIEDVAHPKGWKKNREHVLDFYNQVRNLALSCNPNSAHIDLANLEEDYDTVIFTQNIDPLHSVAGSSKVYHLHGEILKARSTNNHNFIYDWRKDIQIGDKCESGSQLRPHIVWFEEMPYYVEEFYNEISICDILVVIGTSLQIGYTVDVLKSIQNRSDIKVYYIDPNPSNEKFHPNINYIKKPATEGVRDLIKLL